jgi:hypothetical protein
MASACFCNQAAKFLTVVVLWTSALGTDSQQQVLIPNFGENMYAQLLMRATSGFLPPADTLDPILQKHSKPGQLFFEDVRHPGQKYPSVVPTRIGWTRLENIYQALSVTWEEGIAGDFVEAGMWGHGTSIFAAGVIKQLNFNRNVWVCDRFDQVLSRRFPVCLLLSGCATSCRLVIRTDLS